MRVGIAADDLTSATDGATPFVLRGQRCTVHFDGSLAPVVAADIVSMNKDSRSRCREEAARRSTATALRLAGADILFHTVDSTIRGHLEAEVLAALSASGRKMALLAPAFPQAGRTTVGGLQFVDGTPVSQTSFAADPVHPVTQPSIRHHFPSVPDQMVRFCALDDVRMLSPASFVQGDEILLICDAATQHDLDLLVAAIAQPRDVLFCGSPGMARALAGRLAMQEAPCTVVPRAALPLAVVGSANITSERQKRLLLGDTAVAHVIVDPARAVESPEIAAQEALDRSAMALTRAKSLAVMVGDTQEPVSDPNRICEALGLVAAQLIRTLPVDGLVLTGGDTASAIFKALDIGEMLLCGELEPGISVGRVESPRPMGVITKAGGFGGVDVLAEAMEFLRNGGAGGATRIGPGLAML